MKFLHAKGNNSNRISLWTCSQVSWTWTGNRYVHRGMYKSALWALFKVFAFIYKRKQLHKYWIFDLKWEQIFWDITIKLDLLKSVGLWEVEIL